MKKKMKKILFPLCIGTMIGVGCILLLILYCRMAGPLDIVWK